MTSVRSEYGHCSTRKPADQYERCADRREHGKPDSQERRSSLIDAVPDAHQQSTAVHEDVQHPHGDVPAEDAHAESVGV